MTHANPSGLHAEPTQREAREHGLEGTVIVIKNWDIRVSGTIMKPSDVRVEEIALHVWGRRGENASWRRINK